MCAPSTETDEAAGDRANDAIRITGAELRAKVIGEGANLGMTQRGRIEAALARRAAQHRCDRQFGRRQHLRRRGQHQDRAEPAGARRPAHDLTTRNALLGRDDRRGRGAGAAQQLPADAGAVAGASGAAWRICGFQQRADADAGAARRARPRGRVPARRHGDRATAAGARSR